MVATWLVTCRPPLTALLAEMVPAPAEMAPRTKAATSKPDIAVTSVMGRWRSGFGLIDRRMVFRCEEDKAELGREKLKRFARRCAKGGA